MDEGARRAADGSCRLTLMRGAVIFPSDFRTEGHILDDVRSHIGIQVRSDAS
jgi:hypothetical protein